ncbi:ECF-type sigma factor [Lysobacter sp. CA196]|uniref:ECF-type sigma factor n=1 Tax=Lysobacter sp. CA196 TaxID=3455606 RepID=UPI003F8D0226
MTTPAPSTAPNDDTAGVITRLLGQTAGQEAATWERIYALLYDDLRRIAGSQLRKLQQSGFSPTSLVSETWLKLAGTDLNPSNRRHLTLLMTRAMRFVLVDEVRRVQTIKRGEGAEELPLEEAVAMAETDIGKGEQLIALNEALDELSKVNERMARVVELRYFGGLTEAEVAALEGVTTRTITRDWRTARAWLQTQLSEAPIPL